MRDCLFALVFTDNVFKICIICHKHKAIGLQMVISTIENKNVTLNLFLTIFPQMTLNFNKADVAVATTLRFCSCDWCVAMQWNGAHSSPSIS